MIRRLFANSGKLLIFTLRKDRVRAPIWIVGIVILTLIVPVSLDPLYPTQADRDLLAITMQNPVMTAMVGQGALDHYTLGAMTAHQMLLFTSLLVALMNILLVVRHTRSDEEDGVTELLQSLPVGRWAYLHSAMLSAVIVNVVLAGAIGLGLFALNLEGMGLNGSLLYGASLGAIGLLFAAITAVFAQLSASSRGALGFAVTALIVSYFIRAIGDIGNETLSWFSPLGWLTRTSIYTDNKWVFVYMILGFTILMFFLAYYLHGLRDIGTGLIPARPGRTHASPLMQGPIGWSWRLERTRFISWAIGMLLIGISYGSVLGDLDQFISDNEFMRRMFEQIEGYTLLETMLPTLMIVISMLAAIPPLLAMGKLYVEEKKQRLAHVIGGVVSRIRLMLIYWFSAAANAWIMLSLAALGLWSAGNQAVEEGLSFPMLYGAAMAYFPALLLMISLVALFIGCLPKWGGLIWIYLTYSFLVLYLGGLLQFPVWMERLSPFGYVPHLPIDSMSYTTMIVLLAFSFVLLGIGLIGYRRRDIAT